MFSTFEKYMNICVIVFCTEEIRMVVKRSEAKPVRTRERVLHGSWRCYAATVFQGKRTKRTREKQRLMGSKAMTLKERRAAEGRSG